MATIPSNRTKFFIKAISIKSMARVYESGFDRWLKHTAASCSATTWLQRNCNNLQNILETLNSDRTGEFRRRDGGRRWLETLIHMHGCHRPGLQGLNYIRPDYTTHLEIQRHLGAEGLRGVTCAPTEWRAPCEWPTSAASRGLEGRRGGRISSPRPHPPPICCPPPSPSLSLSLCFCFVNPYDPIIC